MSAPTVTITRTQCDTIRGALLLLLALSIIVAANNLWDAIRADGAWDTLWHGWLSAGASYIAFGVRSMRRTLKEARAVA